MNRSPKDLTCQVMTSRREIRPPLSRKIYRTRSESSYQLVSFNKFNLSNVVWELSTLSDTPRDRVSFADQLKHASGLVSPFLLNDRVSENYLRFFHREIREFLLKTAPQLVTENEAITRQPQLVLCFTIRIRARNGKSPFGLLNKTWISTIQR